MSAKTPNPNVVIIMDDQQRADLCGREGFPMAVLPFADSLALSNVCFDKAYTVAPASMPARCSMFTGCYWPATHVHTNHNTPDMYYKKDMLEVFKEQRYKTALVGKNHAHVKGKDFDYCSEDFTRDEPLTFAKEGALQPNKIVHFDELNTWTQSGTERMVRKDDWKLVLDNYGRGELYNLKADPSEINNLYNKKKYASKQMELLEELMTWELRVQHPLPVPRNRYHFKRNPYNYHFEDKKK
ncbi:sulfatase-like hydrolase/transferase [Bacteroides sp. AN502(2024)]